MNTGQAKDIQEQNFAWNPNYKQPQRKKITQSVL